VTGRELLDVLSAVLLLSGVAFAVVAGLGMLRLPDVFSRMHAATKPSTLGLALILSGAALRVENGGDAATLVLIGAFQFLTVPVGAHMIGRSSYQAGTGALDELVVDELRDAQGERPAG
jgi:multicomponent Na+:H+ antiporter subunit G